MLCETEIINKNPKYRVIKYDDEYLMVDVISTWLVYFFPFINWFIPKRCAKISREEYEKLNTVKPVKNKKFLACCRRNNPTRCYFQKVHTLT
ncbi:hypothetical protein Y001_08760 [Staphylococcus aureus MUF256]|nr:hypothetical protein Y001_08760 [Staphylococcus aureus MUF256]